MSKNTIVGIIIASLIVFAVGYYIYRDVTGPAIDTGDTNATSTTSTPTSTVQNIPPKPVVSAPLLPKAPTIDRPILFTDSTPKEMQESMRKEIGNIALSLKTDGTNFNNWMDLGLLRHTIGDYEGAREAWEYASALRPKNSISFSNLGNVYGYYLKDAAKAEKNLLQAIANDTKLVYLYMQTYDFYRDVLKDSVKAKGIIEKGVAVTGDDQLKKFLTEL